MKAKIHPQWYNDSKVTCACGNTFTTGSTLPEIKVEICADCHPFFTGEMKFIDTLGRVEKFKQQQVKMARQKYVKKSLRKKLIATEEDKLAKLKPKSLKEMLQRELNK